MAVGKPSGLGTPAAVALYVSAVVGPGILALPAAAARIAGPLSLVALAALLVLSVPAAFAFVHIHAAAEGRHAPAATNGIHRYVTLAFGPLAGRVVGVWFYLGVPIGVPALALIGGSYASAAVGGGRATTVVVAWAIAVLALLAAWRAGRSGGGLTLVLAAVLATLLVTAAVVSVPHWRPGGLTELAPSGWLAILPAGLTLAWVLMGWEASTGFTGLLRDPGRLPRVIGISLGLVVVLYGCVALPELLVLGPTAGGTDAPVAALLADGLGRAGGVAAGVLGLVLAVANATAYLISMRELGASLIPSFAGPRRRPALLVVPAAVTLLGLVAASLAPIDASWFVRLCAGSQIPVYVAALAAGLVLVRRRTRAWWLVLLATVAVGLLLVPAGPFLLIPLVLAVGVLAWSGLLRSRGRPSVRGEHVPATDQRGQPRDPSLHAPDRDPAHGLEDDRAAHLAGPVLPLDEGDRDLADP